METFLEVKQAAYLLFVIVLLFSHVLSASGHLIDCIKKNECSCRTNEKPPREVSLWQINPDEDILSAKIRSARHYAVNLCHSVQKEELVKSRRCPNSTVCQYSKKNKTEIFSVGQLGTAKFSHYNFQKKSINLHYIGIRQGNITRSINITLQCDESGTARAEYTGFEVTLFNNSKFVGKIKTKAACLPPVQPNCTTSVTPGPKSSTYFKTTTTLTSKSLSPSTTLAQVTTPLSKISSKRSGISTSSLHVTTKSELITSSATPLSISMTSVAISASLAPTSSRLMPSSLTSASTSPTPTSGGLRSKKRLKTVYIVLIVVGGCIIVVILAVYASYKLFRRRRRSLLDGEDDSDNEYGQSTLETRPI